jgi:hypothetical protein
MPSTEQFTPQQPYNHANERLARLLPVAKGRIRYPNVVGHIYGYRTIVKGYFGYFGIREQIAVKIRLGDIVERKYRFGTLQKVRFFY